MGFGSNAASMLLTGKQQFLAGEEESLRVLVEFGPFFGLTFMTFRLLLVVMVAAKALARAREHQPLALFMVPTLMASMVLSTLEQPTVQGFAVITLGFSLASLKRVKMASAEGAPVSNLQWAAGKYGPRAL
jgi:hypothetical protein